MGNKLTVRPDRRMQGYRNQDYHVKRTKTRADERHAARKKQRAHKHEGERALTVYQQQNIIYAAAASFVALAVGFVAYLKSKA